MSSIQAFSLPVELEAENIRSYSQNPTQSNLHDHTSSTGYTCVLSTTSTSWQTCDLNALAMSYLYPNNTAIPIKWEAEISGFRHASILGGECHCGLQYNGTYVWDQVFDSTQIEWKTESSDTKTSTAYKTSKSNTIIRLGVRRQGATSAVDCNMRKLNSLTHYFTRYDFSATAGTGVTSAYISNNLLPSPVKSATGGVYSYWQGAIGYTVVDGHQCISVTNNTTNIYPDGGICNAASITANAKYVYRGKIKAPSGKDIRIGMRLTSGGNAENIVIRGTGQWQEFEHAFIATGEMSGELEFVENGDEGTSRTWYLYDLALCPTIATGYDGDAITYVAIPAEGYRFDHWSDGSTDNPHTITVSGADKTLTAYGSFVGKNLSVLHGNSLIVNDVVTGNVTVAIGQALGSLPFTLSDGAKTLNCKGKYMTNNVTVGARTLLCKDKIASYHIPILLSSGEWKSNYALNRSSSDHTVALNGWIITPYIKIPAECKNITIESGGTQANECLEEYDSNLGYLSYWGGGSNPRTFNFDYPGSIAYVRATFNMANLANCYIKDNTHNVYIFRGGNV